MVLVLGGWAAAGGVAAVAGEAELGAAGAVAVAAGAVCAGGAAGVVCAAAVTPAASRIGMRVKRCIGIPSLLEPASILPQIGKHTGRKTGILLLDAEDWRA